MASSFPFLIRIAAGLVSDAVDVVKRIPEELPTVGVTLVGKAAKLSFELNQQLAALAVRGDGALAVLSGGAEPPPERTAWSTIDEEDEVAANDPQAAARWDSVAEAEIDPILPKKVKPKKKFTPVESDALGFPAAEVSSLGAAGPTLGGTKLRGPKVSAAESGASDISASDISAADRNTADRSAADDSTSVIDGYQQLSLAQLRGKLRSMTPEQLSAALTFEQLHQSRPAFLTLLTNRLSTIAGR